MSIFLVREYNKTRNLPLGHIARKKAEKQLDNEYKHARKLEGKYYFPRKITNWYDVSKLVGHLCRAFNYKYPKLYWDRYDNDKIGAYAFCRGREITFTSLPGVITVCHELAHYINFVDCSLTAPHSGDFLVVEKLLLDEAEHFYKSM